METVVNPPSPQSLQVQSSSRSRSSSFNLNRDDESNQKLSAINGAINKMTKQQLQEKMTKLHVNPYGSKDVLKKRLKNHYKKQRLGNTAKATEEKMKYPYFVVIDFEATCSETNDDFIHEIIEFPAVLIDTQNMVICNTFQRYCKPVINPILTEFCSDLTGISQDQVNKSKGFIDVLKDFEEWLVFHRLGTEHKFAIVTDGPWDMSRFLKTQTDVSCITFPVWAKQWINLRKAYSAFYDVGRCNLQHMLDDLGMKFEGRPHCGLDDAKNIANIAVRLLKDGCVMRINEYLYVDGKRQSFEYCKSSKKSALTKQNEESKKCQAISSSDIPQEGEDISDLLELVKIQTAL